MKKLLERLGLGRRDLRAWAMYDWANSAVQTTIIAAVFPIYFHNVVAKDLGDALSTSRFAWATTIAIVGRSNSAMANEADHAITYDNGAIYELPIVALLLFAKGLAEGTATEREAATIADALAPLPTVLRATLALEESRANRALWAHLSDAELSSVQDRILAALEPLERSEWVEVMRAAGNLAERAALATSLETAAACAGARAGASS